MPARPRNKKFVTGSISIPDWESHSLPLTVPTVRPWKPTDTGTAAYARSGWSTLARLPPEAVIQRCRTALIHRAAHHVLAANRGGGGGHRIGCRVTGTVSVW